MSLLQGEWWLQEDGQSVFADGDVGEQNHETAAFEHFCGVEEDFRERYGFAPGGWWDEETAAGDYFRKRGKSVLDACPGLEEFQSRGGRRLEIDWPEAFREKKIMSCLLRFFRETEPDAEKIAGNELISAASLKQMIKCGLDVLFIEAGGHKDARKYALKHGGWIRVKNDDFDLWEISDKALRQIRRSDVWEQAQIDPEDLDTSDEEINLYENSSREYFPVPVKILLDDSVSALAIKKMGKYGRRGEPEFALNPRKNRKR